MHAAAIARRIIGRTGAHLFHADGSYDGEELASAAAASAASIAAAANAASAASSSASAAASAAAVAVTITQGGEQPQQLQQQPLPLPLFAQLVSDDPQEGLWFRSALQSFKTRTCYANTGACQLA